MRPSNIREENIRQILELLRISSEPLSRAEIARRLNLSAPSVSAIVQVLLEKKMLYEVEAESSSRLGGRKPIWLRLREDCAYVMGIHIDSRTISLVVSDVHASVMHEHVVEYDQAAVDCVPFLVQEIKKLLSDRGIGKGALLSIGIAVPGAFDVKSGVITLAPNIRHWENIPLAVELGQQFDCDVLIENVVNMAVVGERWKGKIQGRQNAVYIKIDQGIRAGILIQGRLYKGFSNMEGEVGFSITDWRSVTRSSKDYGALESICSTLAIENRVKERLQVNMTFGQIVDQAEKGQQYMRDILLEASSHIAVTVANVVSVLNPEIVVIGGQFCEAQSVVNDHILSLIERAVPNMPELVFSDLEETVYCLGAVHMALDGIEDRLVERIILEDADLSRLRA